jgi:integrase
MGLCVHSLRATAATNALSHDSLSHDSDIAKVQEWLGHANVSTTRLYDRRKSKLRCVRSRAAAFFISYTSADRVWAEWIAWQLEEAEYQPDDSPTFPS